ncbi:MAG TPA: precorrin-3B C(17)-methyltransferase [Pelagibacterium sp.]|uniref:precorrin-3B C(17)-methyltransferase n=1 Tax=Pelagibacterium sp. TaxID=1967288 RepID=UPI002BCC150B|nr:precorrin-3B C(17)-methyltransferase [Pelagibacterium sp.]HWJ88113.1 precorrin-3B C(17)-methyltransferase [Pelagibacterium sp.]
MSGTLYIVGLGPGTAAQMTPQAQEAIAASSHFLGYKPYIDRLDLRADQTALPSDNREELDRARAALDLAAGGHVVTMVSGGDPGVFAMAAAVCEALDAEPERWAATELVVVPGITAMLAVAARIGAPLGNDFCAISLSDNLKPWSVIERRVRAAAEAGFVMAFYNPISKARPWQLGAALDMLRTILPGETVVIVGRAVGRKDETVGHQTLATVRPEDIDMSTCLIVGNRLTRVVAREGQSDLVYTPRWVKQDE